MNNKYIAYNGHKIGASHVSRGMECEDFSASYTDERLAIAVISDGHGDKNCFRSAIGAMIACNVAIESVQKAFEKYEAAVDEWKQSPEKMIQKLEKDIIGSWKEEVLADSRNNPFLDEELASLDEAVVDTLKRGQKHEKIYGCTLILCAVLDDFWFGIQIGDGRCVVCQKNGMYGQPIPWDETGCVGNRSTSLCDTAAIDHFRHYYSEELPAAVFVASDGVDESFDENGLNKCYYSIAVWIHCLPEQEYSGKIQELLGKISQGGSGDDVSVACLVSAEEEVKKPYATSAQVAEKMEELFGMLREAEERYRELAARYNEVCKKKADLKVEIDKAEQKLGVLSEQFTSAKEMKKQVDDYWIRQNVEVVDNSGIMDYVPILKE